MSSVRPTIYIGLGGTGINAVARTKKMFEDAYGKENISKLPVRFVCIDYDKSARKDPKNATDISADFIDINNVASPRETYRIQHENGKYKWFFPQDVQFMDEKVTSGAAQVRGYGRFLTEMIMTSIEAKLKTAYRNVKNIQQEITDQTQQIHTVDCHIVMSLAGGTGCGSFLNIAWALRQLFQGDVNLIGYGVLYSVFRTMDVYGNQTPRVVSNSYSAILDLDYLMSATEIEPIKVSMNGKDADLTRSLYDQFYVIDNETENGKVVKDVNSICEVIGTCLFASAGVVGDKVDSILSNVHWKKGHQYNIQPKNGWVQGLGACQVVYNGDSLAEIYSGKASIELIKQLLDSDTDSEQRAQNWTETVRIREDGTQFNYLTDSLYGKEKISRVNLPDLDIKDSIPDIKNAVTRYLSNLPDFPTEGNIKFKADKLCEDLESHVKGVLNANHGIGNSLAFLKNLKSLISTYKREMENESESLIKEYTQVQQVLEEKGFKEYEAESKKLFKTRSSKEQDLVSEIAKPAQKILRLKLEAERRRAAASIFSAMISKIDTLEPRINAIKEKLLFLQDGFSALLLEKQRASLSSSVFQIDLSAGERVNMPFDGSDVHVNEYFNLLGGRSLLDIDPASDDLKDSIHCFTHNLNLDHQRSETPTFPQYNIYKDKLLDEVIAELKANNPERYADLKNQINNLASRLLVIDDRGMQDVGGRAPSQKLNRVYFICHYEQKNAHGDDVNITFENDPQFTNDDNVAFLKSDSDYFRQRMIFYRADFAVIPYCIDAFSDHIIEKEYLTALSLSSSDNSDLPHPHFDKIIFEEMKKKDFKLKPEIRNEAMFYWVCGNILNFGWESFVESAYIMQKDENGYPVKIDHKEEVSHKKYIRFYKGKYQYWNAGGKSSGINGNWITINTPDRRNAFNRFKVDYLPGIKSELAKQIKEQLTTNGIGSYELSVKELIESGKFNYIDLEAIGSKNSAVLYSQRTQEAEQYDDEWNYIVNELFNALNNILRTR